MQDVWTRVVLSVLLLPFLVGQAPLCLPTSSSKQVTSLPAQGTGGGIPIRDKIVDLFQQGKTDEANALAKRCLAEASRSGDRPAFAEATDALGICQFMAGRTDEALSCFEKALGLWKSLGNRLEEARTMNHVGAVYQSRKDYRHAMDAILEAERLFRQIGDSRELAKIYNNLGVIYLAVKDYSRAHNSFLSAMASAEKVDDEATRLSALANRGSIYLETREYDRALSVFEATLVQSRLHSLPALTVEAMAGIGEAQLFMGKPDVARRYLSEACLQGVQTTPRSDLASRRGLLALALARTGSLDEARREALACIDESHSIQEWNAEATGYSALAEVCQSLGNFREGLEYLKRAHKLSMDVYETDSRQILQEIQHRFQTDAHQKELELLNQDAGIRERTLQTQNARSQLLGAISLPLLGVLVIFWLIFRARTRTMLELAGKSQELETTRKKLEKAARTDSLTGLLNRRGLSEQLVQETAMARRTGQTLCIILGDVDWFKRINDRHGHEAGDLVLQHISRTVRNILRGQDLLARWGGEEFLWILPETDLASGVATAEKIRSLLAQYPAIWRATPIPVSMTFGVSIYSGTLPFEESVRMADMALYQGKQEGRNRVVVARANTKPISGREEL